MKIPDTKKFRVRELVRVLDGGVLNTKKFIILMFPDGTYRMTNFHVYVIGPGRHSRESDGNNRFDFVVQFLNYTFFTCGLDCLDHLTIDMIIRFFRAYSVGKLSNNNKISEKTLLQCKNAVHSFLMNLKNERPEFRLDMDKAFTTHKASNQYGREFDKIDFAFFVESYTEEEDQQLRDIPTEAFHIILRHVIKYHTDILMLFALSAFGGLRPSEACNIRIGGTKCGPNIFFETVDGKIERIWMDIQNETAIRSDGKKVGGIKKHRVHSVQKMFLNIFCQCYEIYQEYLENEKIKLDEEYGAMTLNSCGKAMSYKTYKGRFEQVLTELIPIFEASDNTKLVMFAYALKVRNCRPHALRHWFTVQLVLAGFSAPEIKNARGDRSIDSANEYLAKKSEFEERYVTVLDGAFEYLLWRGDRLYGQEGDISWN